MQSFYGSPLNFSLRSRKSVVTRDFDFCDQSRMDLAYEIIKTGFMFERAWLAFLLHELVELTLPSEEERI
jgi:hypothetical protein